MRNIKVPTKKPKNRNEGKHTIYTILLSRYNVHVLRIKAAGPGLTWGFNLKLA